MVTPAPSGLVLLRHGSTRLNEARRYQGRLNRGLSDRGRAQARAAGRACRDAVIEPREVRTSPLRRAVETARLAFPDARLQPDPRLVELDFGVFEGATCAENLARHGDAFRRWIDAPGTHPPPGGEALGALEARVRAWWEQWGRAGGAVAVTHGGPLRVLVALHLGLPTGRARAGGATPRAGDAPPPVAAPPPGSVVCLGGRA